RVRARRARCWTASPWPAAVAPCVSSWCSAKARRPWMPKPFCAARAISPEPCWARMPRYKLTIEYDGSGFVGWQRQTNGLSIQQALEEAILAFSGEDVRTQTAGRTDAGVHALGQVAHVDLSRQWDPFRVSEALNYHLRPHRIAVLACEAVPESFE